MSDGMNDMVPQPLGATGKHDIQRVQERAREDAREAMKCLDEALNKLTAVSVTLHPGVLNINTPCSLRRAEERLREARWWIEHWHEKGW